MFLDLTHKRLSKESVNVIVLVASKLDIASRNIKAQILKNYPFTQTTLTFQQNPTYTANINNNAVTLITLEQESVTAQNLPQAFPETQLFVFISRHSSQSGKPTLSVHTPGNFAEATLGGLPQTVSVSPATAMRDALKMLQQQKEQLNLDYEVTYECTHHGPSFAVPTMFVELGSSEPQWRDTVAAQAVAHAAMAAITKFHIPNETAVLGIGGPHYNQKFTEMALTGEAVFGHMIPKYAISVVNEAMLKQCVTRTLEKVSMAVLDWKGIKSEDKPKLLFALQNSALPFMQV